MRAALRPFIVLGLIAAIAGAPVTAAAQKPQTAPNEPELWRTMLERLDAGAMVAVRLKDGSRTRGTVLQVGDHTFTFKPHTRIPVPAREVAFADVTTIERHKSSMSPAQKVLLGTGIGAASFFLFMAMLLAGTD